MEARLLIENALLRACEIDERQAIALAARNVSERAVGRHRVVQRAASVQSDALDQRHEGPGEREPLRIERRGQQRRASSHEQVAALGVARRAAFGQHHAAPALKVDRDDDIPVVRSLREQDGAVAGKKLRHAHVGLSALRVERRDDFGTAAARGHRPKRRSPPEPEHDTAILAPARTHGLTDRVGDVDCGPTFRRHSSQLPVREKADPSAIGRKKWAHRARRARKRCCSELVYVPNVQALSFAAGCGDDQGTSVRRERERRRYDGFAVDTCPRRQRRREARSLGRPRRQRRRPQPPPRAERRGGRGSGERARERAPRRPSSNSAAGGLLLEQ